MKNIITTLPYSVYIYSHVNIGSYIAVYHANCW